MLSNWLLKIQIDNTIMAAGIAVRNIAPLVSDKWKDPAVVVVDSGLNFAIPVLGGHHGGMNWQKNLPLLVFPCDNDSN